MAFSSIENEDELRWLGKSLFREACFGLLKRTFSFGHRSPEIGQVTLTELRAKAQNELEDLVHLAKAIPLQTTGHVP